MIDSRQIKTVNQNFPIRSNPNELSVARCNKFKHESQQLFAAFILAILSCLYGCLLMALNIQWPCLNFFVQIHWSGKWDRFIILWLKPGVCATTDGIFSHLSQLNRDLISMSSHSLQQKKQNKKRQWMINHTFSFTFLRD